MSDKKFARRWKEIDQDRSGAIEYEEFLQWWQKQDPEVQEEP